MTQSILYPRPTDIRLFLRWVNRGDVAWDDTVKGRRLLPPAIKDLIIRLELEPRYEVMRLVAVTNPGQIPSDALLTAILSNLRIHGYVYPTGPVPDGRVRPRFEMTPIGGRQLHMVRMYAWGATTLEISKELGIYTSSVRERMVEARKETGTHTVAQLVACCYRNDWFPGRWEYNSLLNGRLLGRGYTTRERILEAVSA